MIKAGERLPELKLQEFVETESEGCSIGPNPFALDEHSHNKKIVIFGLPGAYTPTCSAQHVPGYIQHHQALQAKGIDEVWCVSVNDAFVMGAWGREQKVGNKVRMLADGNAEFTKKIGLEMDLAKYGMGLRSQRYAMLVENGIVKSLWVEAPGKFEVSSAEAVLKQL
jgi:peroxiredoxin